VLHAANQQQPGSFANVISILANPGSNENPIRLNYEMMVPGLATAAPIEVPEENAEYALSAVVSREGRVQGVEVLNQSGAAGRSVNTVLHDAYRMQFSPAVARGDAVAVSVVWLVSNTTVKGRRGDDIDALRSALRARTTPQPIGPLPVPAEAEPKLVPAPLKPVGPDASSLAAAGGG
jgi:hypothetical protein